MNTVFESIATYSDKYPQLCHASNILTKYADNQCVDELTEIAQQYIRYLEANLALRGYSDDIIRQRVVLLNDYYNFIHDSGYDNLYKAQSKFRPTILEEFLFILLRDFVVEHQTRLSADDTLECGSVKAYSNLYFKAASFEDFVVNPDMAINEKDQDFAIYRKILLTVNNTKSIQLQVPAVAIEAKSYIDKTMLEGIIATAEKVKSGNPYALFIAVSETYDVALNVDPAYSRIDQIYVLRKSTRKGNRQQVDADVTIKMFKHIQTHLQRPWSDVRKRLTTEGVIM